VIKITYDIPDERIRELMRYANREDKPGSPTVGIGSFEWHIRYWIQEAFDAGREFQKRYREDEEET
jgi:hypothetical protein